ncbi:hypothetical protein AGLY_013899 [Aphis glycines]|uniref:Uncharacterized protein n=1 Tax=Aphis glycines TaxID=307491 RepID=A0A6G0T5D6_APHGL|nr:hypothetical protein AGLY_013899 [Aphis glycines]
MQFSKLFIRLVFVTSKQVPRKSSVVFGVILIIHYLIKIEWNHVPEKIKCTESCFTDWWSVVMSNLHISTYNLLYLHSSNHNSNQKVTSSIIENLTKKLLQTIFKFYPSNKNSHISFSLELNIVVTNLLMKLLERVFEIFFEYLDPLKLVVNKSYIDNDLLQIIMPTTVPTTTSTTTAATTTTTTTTLPSTTRMVAPSTVFFILNLSKKQLTLTNDISWLVYVNLWGKVLNSDSVIPSPATKRKNHKISVLLKS